MRADHGDGRGVRVIGRCAALVETAQDPVRGLLRLVASPIRFDGVAPPTRRPPPLLGEHDDQVRRNLEDGTDP